MCEGENRRRNCDCYCITSSVVNEEQRNHIQRKHFLLLRTMIRYIDPVKEKIFYALVARPSIWSIDMAWVLSPLGYIIIKKKVH